MTCTRTIQYTSYASVYLSDLYVNPMHNEILSDSLFRIIQNQGTTNKTKYYIYLEQRKTIRIE